MTIDTRLEPNCCWLSGLEIFEAKTTFPQDHPLAGHVLRMGKVLPEAYRVTLLLADGTNTTVNIHKSVVHEVKDRLVELWNNVRQRYIFQHQNKDVYYVKGDMTNYDQSLKSNVERIDDNPPIDVLGIESWQTLADIQKAIRT